MGTFIPTEIRSQQVNPPRPSRRYLARYFHENSWYGVDVYATSFHEAEIICRAHNLQLDGEHMATIPAFAGAWLPNLILWIRNYWRDLW